MNNIEIDNKWKYISINNFSLTAYNHFAEPSIHRVLKEFDVQVAAGNLRQRMPNDIKEAHEIYEKYKYYAKNNNWEQNIKIEPQFLKDVITMKHTKNILFNILKRRFLPNPQDYRSTHQKFISHIEKLIHDINTIYYLEPNETFKPKQELIQLRQFIKSNHNLHSLKQFFNDKIMF